MHQCFNATRVIVVKSVVRVPVIKITFLCAVKRMGKKMLMLRFHCSLEKKYLCNESAFLRCKDFMHFSFLLS